MRVGVIGGTGFYSMKHEVVEIDTPYGSIPVFHWREADREVFFISRHGKKKVPPHLVNYHGIIEALHACGVDAVVALNTVGAMKKEVSIGSFFIPNDFIDCTGRSSTFFDTKLVHIDMSEPFCPVIRNILFEEAVKRGEVNEGTYVVTQGPRFETKAEIRIFSHYADVVGMTLSPEIVLAREREICYASLCLVSNFAAGMQTSLNVEEIRTIHEMQRKHMMDVVMNSIKRIPKNRTCGCNDAVSSGTL